MFIADTHCDTIGYVLRGIAKFVDRHNAPKLPHIQVYAMYCELENIPPEKQRDMVEKFTETYYECVEKETSLLHCDNIFDAEKALNKGKSASMLSVEGCNFISDLKELELLRKNGVRFAGLTWNFDNIVGCGAPRSGTLEDRGLTDYGKEFVTACEDLGIVVDVSHASDKTIDDVLCIAKKPIIATHSNFREICGHVRNLRKEHSDEIVRRGGYIGLNLYGPFVKGGVLREDYKMEMLLPHVSYALENGYGGNIGFGFDIDGVSWEYASDVSLEESIHEQYIKMLKKELDEKSLARLCGENFKAFMERYDGGI